MKGKILFLISICCACIIEFVYMRGYWRVNLSLYSPHHSISTTPPNILVFLVDDWGWGHLHINTQKDGLSATPHMDAFAKKGLRFTDFHAASSVCTPSRAALLTGRIGLRTDMNRLLGPYNVAGLQLQEITAADILKQKGYSTFAIGKWHLGHNGHYHPTERGFDHYFGVPYSLDQGCMDYARYILPQRDTCANEKSSYFVGLPLYKRKEIIEQPLNLRNISKSQVMEFKRRIEEIKNIRSQFFGYVAFNHVHVPLGFSQKFANSTATIFNDTLKELDSSFGEMIDILKENRLYENTMIWLLSDNGPWETECQFSGSAGPFQGLWQRKHGGGTTGKKEVWEGGHRVPGVVSWPAVIAPNRISNAIISSLDILPTVTKLLNITLPEDRGYDGIDITDILLGKSNKGHTTLFHPRSDGKSGNISAIRYHNYKAVFESGGRHYFDCQQHESPHRYFNPPLLFDLEKDPAEENPLDTSFPQYRDVLENILTVRREKLKEIESDKKSKFNGEKSDDAVPCCNKKNKFCRC